MDVDAPQAAAAVAATAMDVDAPQATTPPPPQPPATADDAKEDHDVVDAEEGEPLAPPAALEELPNGGPSASPAAEKKAADKPKDKSSSRRDPIALPRTRVQSVASEVTTTSQPIAADCLYAISRATELFLELLVTKLSEGRFKSNEEINVLYDDLARTLMDHPDRFSFLADVVPLKSHIDACFPKEDDGEGGDVEGKGAAMANGSLGGGDEERAPGAVGMEPDTTPPSPPPTTAAAQPTMPTSTTTTTTTTAAAAEPRVAEGGPQGHG